MSSLEGDVDDIHHSPPDISDAVQHQDYTDNTINDDDIVHNNSVESNEDVLLNVPTVSHHQLIR